MLKVDLIYSYWISAPTGASHFVGKMKGMKELFLQQDVDLRVISADIIKPRVFDNNKTKQKFKVKIAFRLAKYSSWLTKFLIHATYGKAAKRILDYYDTVADKGDVIAFQETLLCYYYLKKYKNRDKKILLTIHNNGDIWSMWYYRYPKMRSSIMNSYKADIERTLFSGCSKIGFVADYPRKNFLSKYPFDEKKTYFVYTSIEKGNTPSPMIVGNKVKLITSGSLGARKNQMGVLNAIGLLPLEYQKQITYTILSDGEIRDVLENKAKTLSAEVIFTGKVDRVDDYLKDANCFVLYSKDEGQPMSIVEAMRMGLPIIGSNVAGIPEQIEDGKTGFIVDLEESHLADKLRYIVDHKNDLPAMGKASYDLFLNRFTIDSMIKKYAEIYKSVVFD